MASVERPQKGDRAKMIPNTNSGEPHDVGKQADITNTVSCPHDASSTQIPNTVSGPKAS